MVSDIRGFNMSSVVAVAFRAGPKSTFMSTKSGQSCALDWSAAVYESAIAFVT